MKQLTCEMCGGTDLIKQDGAFVCQNCGMKYSVEEAKKMMIEGTVKIDDRYEFSNLCQLAVAAKNRKDYKQAAKFYNELLIKIPNSWEANYYSVYAEAMDIKVGEIPNAIERVSNNLEPVFSLINKSNYSSEEQIQIIQEIGKSFFELTNLFFVNCEFDTKNQILIAQEDFYLQFCKYLCNNNEFMNDYGTNFLVNKLKGIYLFEDENMPLLDLMRDFRKLSIKEYVQKINEICAETLKQYNPELFSKVQKEMQQQQQQQQQQQ